MPMEMNYCMDCGTKLVLRHHDTEGEVPYCENCRDFRYPVFNTAVSMIVMNDARDRIILIQQYGKPSYVLVAGYVNRTEPLELAVVRELKEETGMTAVRIRFNRTRFFEPSNTLMCNFTAFVKDDSELSPNYEIDSWAWFSFDEARKNVNPEILAGRFLNACLDDLENPTGNAEPC